MHSGIAPSLLWAWVGTRTWTKWIHLNSVSIRHRGTHLTRKNNPVRRYSSSARPQTQLSFTDSCDDKPACWRSQCSVLSLHRVFKSRRCQGEQTKTLVRLKARNSIFSWQILAAHINSDTPRLVTAGQAGKRILKKCRLRRSSCQCKVSLFVLFKKGRVSVRLFVAFTEGCLL